jgi:uncharacterized protein (DUF1684 family)
MGTDWKESVREEREARDEYFSSNPHSPIPAAERTDFEGLSFYPIGETYRFVIPLYEHEEKQSITVGTSTGGEREFLRWGEFRFELDGQTATLQAYKSDPDDDRLWVPFRDETNGEETYGAGRYLDLEDVEHRTPDGDWILDFNEAYNPTCAYADDYECPLPPTENWLDVRIEAGEKAVD